MSSVREIMKHIRDQLSHPLSQEQQQETILQTMRVARELKSEYLGEIRDVVLFGGYARREAVDLSDVDLAVKLRSNNFDFNLQSEQLDTSTKQIARSLGLPHIKFHITPIGSQWVEKPRKYKSMLDEEVLRAIRDEGKSLLR